MCSKIMVSLLDDRVETKGWIWLNGETRENVTEMSNEEYRMKIIDMVSDIDRSDILRLIYGFTRSGYREEKAGY